MVENLDDSSDINVQDHIQATPLHDATEFGEFQTMVVLLQHGADLNIKDNVSPVDNDVAPLYASVQENKTPYDLAKEKNSKDMVAVIDDYRKHGPSVLKKYERQPLRRVGNNGVASSPADKSRDKVRQYY